MKRIALGVLIAVVISLSLMFFLRSKNNPVPETPVEPKTEITIAQFGDFFLYAPLYIAIDAGFFDENNLSVDLISTGGDDKTWAAVMSGNASFGVADPTFVAIADARGQPGFVVASIVNGVPFWGVTFAEDVPEITEGSQLSGYTVATFPAPSTAYTLQKDMFMDAEIEPSIRQGAFGALLPMLEAGQADIALELEPNVSQAVNSGARVVYSLGKIYGDFAITGLTVAPELASDSPEIVESVVCAIEKSLGYIRNKPDDALEILAKRFPEVDRSVAKDALTRVINDEILPAQTTVAQDAWQKAISVREEVGDIANPKDFNYYVRTEFSDRAGQNPDCRYTSSM